MLGRALPLAVYTLATVVGGVYLEDRRPLVFAAAAVLAVAYVTVTFKRWVAAREAHREEVEATEAEAGRKRRAEEARRAREREEAKAGTGGVTHCVACGAPSDRPVAFCPACGVPSPLAIACPRCEAPTTPHRHILKRTWAEHALHCAARGARHTALPRAAPESPGD